MRTVARFFVLPWYLVGWILHAYLGLFAPEVYRPFGSTALLPGSADLWGSVVMPHIRLFALLLAGFELAVTVPLLQLGLGYHMGGLARSFVVYRLPNLVLVAIQVPLLSGAEVRPMPQIVRGWMGRSRSNPPSGG